MAVEWAGRTETTSALDGLPQAGEVVGGKFVIERVLGVGGMGVVLAARHTQLGQNVAIKFLRRTAASSPEAVSRFLREARAVVALQSAHVVRVMDVGTLDDGLPYMVMEHLSGTDLGHVLEVRTAVPVEEAVDYLLQAIEAIAEAHAAGIVHRDLKPSNRFLTLRPDGSPLVKVLDFGISKAVPGGPEPLNLTDTAVVLGSPLYMSPEQVRSTKNVDTRTDIWALGVIIYELLAGTPPFEADSVTGLCAKIVADPPAPLRLRRPEVPVALEAVILRCLEKDITRRPRSVSELAAALQPFASIEGRLAVDRIVRIGGGLRASDPGGSSRIPKPTAGPVFDGYAETVATQQTSRTIRRRRAATVGLSAIGLALVVVWAARSRPLAHDASTPAAIGATPTMGTPAALGAPAATGAAAGPSAATSAAASVTVTLAPISDERAAAATGEAASAASTAASSVASPPKNAPRWVPAPPVRAAAHTVPAKSGADDLLLDRK
jgi:serine/threonine-protein kinase